MKWKFAWKFLSILWALLILIAALIDFIIIEKAGWFEIPYADKLAHFLTYSLFSLFTFLGFASSSKKERKLWLITFSYSITIELLHLFVPYRNFEFQDIAANVLGTFIGIMLFYIVRKYLEKFLFVRY